MGYRAVLSVGSNMGDPAAYVSGVAAHFSLRGELELASSLYTTKPWGVTEQPAFVNQTLLVTTELKPNELLTHCQALEQEACRVRDKRWGPRTLDVDIIQIRDGEHELRSDNPELTLPHPRAHLRAFVLVPWLEIEPEATLSGTPIVGILRTLGDDVDGVQKLAQGGRH